MSARSICASLLDRGLVELSEEIELDWPEFLLVIKVGTTQNRFWVMKKK